MTAVKVKMKNSSTWVIASCFLWVVIFCGWAFISLFYPGLGTTWKKEIPPPEQPSKLVLGNKGEALAETLDGRLFEYTRDVNQSWVEVTTPSGTTAWLGDAVCNSGNRRYIVISPPGKIKSLIKESCGYLESSYHLEIALLENGEIWIWEHEVYAYTHLLNAFILIIIGLLGTPFLAVWFVIEIFRKMRKRPTRRQK